MRKSTLLAISSGKEPSKVINTCDSCMLPAPKEVQLKYGAAAKVYGYHEDWWDEEDVFEMVKNPPRDSKIIDIKTGRALASEILKDCVNILSLNEIVDLYKDASIDDKFFHGSVLSKIERDGKTYRIVMIECDDPYYCIVINQSGVTSARGFSPDANINYTYHKNASPIVNIDYDDIGNRVTSYYA